MRARIITAVIDVLVLLLVVAVMVAIQWDPMRERMEREGEAKERPRWKPRSVL